jgi:hypothetical protein
MTSRVRRSIVLVLLLAAAYPPHGLPAASPRVVAVGDIHGDLDSLVRILGRAGLIDQGRRWTGGSAVLVQTGDFTDRGPRVRAVMDLLMSLQAGARKAGGQVHVLLGNHEGMNLLTLTRDVSAESMAGFADARSEKRRNDEYDRYVALSSDRNAQLAKPVPVYQPPPREQWLATHPPGSIEYLEALGPKGSYGRWLRSLPAAIKIGDTIFMHAGVDPTRAPERLDDITANIRREVVRFDELRRNLIADGWAIPSFTLNETIAAAQVAYVVDRDARWNGNSVPAQDWDLISPGGPLWFSGLATGATPDLEAPLVTLLERYKARRIVVGHSVMANGRIGQRFDGRVVLIDTGMLSSHYPAGRASALEVLDGRMHAIYDDGKVVFGSAK